MIAPATRSRIMVTLGLVGAAGHVECDTSPCLFIAGAIDCDRSPAPLCDDQNGGSTDTGSGDTGRDTGDTGTRDTASATLRVLDRGVLPQDVAEILRHRLARHPTK